MVCLSDSIIELKCSNDGSQNIFFGEIWLIIPVTPSYLEHRSSFAKMCLWELVIFRELF